MSIGILSAVWWASAAHAGDAAASAATSSPPGEVSIPSAPRPAQIEPMVAPVKREAPPVPVIKSGAKVAGKSDKSKSDGEKKPAAKSSSKTAEKADAKKKR